MNNKGFTLVELLAVLVILVTISLVAVGSVTNSLTRREKKDCEEQIELAISAAKIYFSLNQGITTVKVETLVSEEYLDPKNSKMEEKNGKLGYLNLTDTITINNGYKYIGTICPS